MELREKHFPDRKRNHHETNTPSSNDDFERSGCWDAVGLRGKRVCSDRSADSIRQSATHAGSPRSPGVGPVWEPRSRTEQRSACEEPGDRWDVEFSVYLHG